MDSLPPESAYLFIDEKFMDGIQIVLEELAQTMDYFHRDSPQQSAHLKVLAAVAKNSESRVGKQRPRRYCTFFWSCSMPASNKPRSTNVFQNSGLGGCLRSLN